MAVPSEDKDILVPRALVVEQLLHLQRQGLAGPQAACLTKPAFADGGGAGRGGAVGAGLHGGQAARARDCRPRGAAAQRDQLRPPPAPQPNPPGGRGLPAGAELQSSNGCAGAGSRRIGGAVSPSAHWLLARCVSPIGYGAPSISCIRVGRPTPGATWGPAGQGAAAADGFRGGLRWRKGFGYLLRPRGLYSAHSPCLRAPRVARPGPRGCGMLEGRALTSAIRAMWGAGCAARPQAVGRTRGAGGYIVGPSVTLLRRREDRMYFLAVPADLAPRRT